jgi:hypothetical protein
VGEPDAPIGLISAINSTALEFKGNKLGGFKAEDITVENNSVKEIKVSEDGKTATVTLVGELIVDTVTRIIVNGKTFEVTYKIEATKVAVTEANYDDIAGQFVAITVVGKKSYCTRIN